MTVVRKIHGDVNVSFLLSYLSGESSRAENNLSAHRRCIKSSRHSSILRQLPSRNLKLSKSLSREIGWEKSRNGYRTEGSRAGGGSWRTI